MYLQTAEPALRFPCLWRSSYHGRKGHVEALHPLPALAETVDLLQEGAGQGDHNCVSKSTQSCTVTK